MWEENLGPQAGVHLTEGVHLTWDPLSTGFTVIQKRQSDCFILIIIRCTFWKSSKNYKNDTIISDLSALRFSQFYRKPFDPPFLVLRCYAAVVD